MPEILKFVPFQSNVDPIFWQIFSTKKLDELKLDDSPIPIIGFYQNSQLQSQNALFIIDYNSFDIKNRKITDLPLYGYLKNTNTIEEFQELNKNELKTSLGGKELWDSIVSGKALDNPLLLSKFFCFSFADLKKFNFHFICCFPTVKYPRILLQRQAQQLSDILTETQRKELVAKYNDITDMATRAYFLVHISKEGTLSIHQLKDFPQLTSGQVMLGFADPSKSKTAPSWVLRNLLSLVAYHWSSVKTDWRVVCYRQRLELGQWVEHHSLMLDVSLVEVDHPAEMPAILGYELNHNQKPLPQVFKLAQILDPNNLAKISMDMNLKLMKWVNAPDLPLDKISSTKCLLMGAGTLGCAVARSLLAWGIKTITLVDNGLVKYSNPARQILYTLEHCTRPNPVKATIAAEELRKIYPDVDTKGYNVSIPMPGHTVSEAMMEQVKKDTELIEGLIQSHDVIFLLLDTREARWLPTMLGAYHKKIVINAALGFESYLVQRHGFKQDPSEPMPQLQPDGPIPGHKLSCYFCSDVVQPGDSTKNRTLDQQCTVTRPGLSMIAASYAVELMVNILKHPLGALAYGGKDEETVGQVLPHSIRGNLGDFSTLFLAMEAFNLCPACSPQVLDKYREDGFQFLMNCFNVHEYLNDITGLSEMQQRANELLDLCMSSDMESDLESVSST